MMKKNIYFLLFALLFLACTEEDSPGISNLDQNWLIIEDSDNPLDHERFLIYDTYGISVYYNDTIGSMMRQDVWGNDYRYYEILQVFYAPGSEKPEGSYTLLGNTDDLLPQLTYAREQIFGLIPDSFYKMPILFVEDMDTPLGSDVTSYMGFNALLVESIAGFGDMVGDERKELDARLLGGLFAGSLFASEAEWMEEFCDISSSLQPDPYTDVYSEDAYYPQTVYWACYGTDLEPTLAALGFIRPLEPSEDLPESDWSTPTRNIDVFSYCELLFRSTEAEVEATYAGYPAVLEKYHMMREKAESYGFTFD